MKIDNIANTDIFKIHVLSSAIHPKHIKYLVEQNYSLTLSHCIFLCQSQNDIYKLTTTDHNVIFAKLMPHFVNSDLEANLIGHFPHENDHSIEISALVKTTNNQLSIQITCPEGERTLLLYRQLTGKPFDWDIESAERYGFALAELHLGFDQVKLADNVPITYYDTTRLIQTPIAKITAFLPTTNQTQFLMPLQNYATKIKNMIDQEIALETVNFNGFIHGDYFHNCFTENNKIKFYDFDTVGYGSRLYDLAMVLWAFEFEKSMWGMEIKGDYAELFANFIKGYVLDFSALFEPFHLSV